MIATGYDITPEDIKNAAPVGGIIMFGGSAAPDDWKICDGASLLRADYPDLFAIIGTAFGAADGTHFNVPNLKGKFPVGYDAGETEFDTLGETGGEKTHLLTSAESGVPAHTHPVDGASANIGNGKATSSQNSGNTGATLANTAADAAQAHNNLPPYIALNFIIRYRYGAPI